jgi:hypothetical protein
MSLWRKEASQRLPELQRIIASRDVDNPMRLWIELKSTFQDLCEQDPLPLDLIKRVWGYAKWCMTHDNGDVATAAALAFGEHLLDRKATRRILPEIMTRADYEGLKGLLLYHNSEEDYANGLKLFETGKRR